MGLLRHSIRYIFDGQEGAKCSRLNNCLCENRSPGGILSEVFLLTDTIAQNPYRCFRAKKEEKQFCEVTCLMKKKNSKKAT